MYKATSNTFREYLLSTNEFMQPKVLTGESAAYTDILRLIMLEPGTNQTHPNMGVGIRSRYRFSDTSDIYKLKEDIKTQMGIYLPNLLIMDIQVEVYDNVVAIFISSYEDESYALKYDTDTGKIGALTLEDIK